MRVQVVKLDTLSVNPIFSDEAIQENKRLNGSITSVVGLGGRLNYDIGTEEVTRSIRGMTVPMDPKKANRSRREG